MGLDSQNLKGLWDDHSLLVIVWERNTLENLQSLESGLTSGGFMWEHASEVSPEHSRWGSEVLELSSWVSVNSLSEEFMVIELVSEKRSRENQLFTSDNNDSLSSQQFFGDLRSKSANQMASTVNDNLLFEHP